MSLQTASANALARTSRPIRLGAWELIEALGQGRLCRVYRARPASGPKRAAAYALKILADKWNDDAAAIEVMRREAIVGRRISHPHLIPILAAHVGAAPYFVVMPWLEGAPLSSFFSAGRRPTLPAALWMVRQVAEALDALHTGGWMHADVKPSNIMLSPRGHATLVDLGFARQPADPMSPADRCVAGTLQYIAPEMITSALRPDIRSDIYSLGATLYELLCGRPPFLAQDLAELAQQHRQREPPDLRALRADLPVNVTALVHSMLAKQPLRRPQTPRELIERLVPLEIETFRLRGGEPPTCQPGIIASVGRIRELA